MRTTGASTLCDFTITCAVHPSWSRLREQLERLRRMDERRAAEEKARADFAPIDEVLAGILTPPQRADAFAVWKATLYEQQHSGKLGEG